MNAAISRTTTASRAELTEQLIALGYPLGRITQALEQVDAANADAAFAALEPDLVRAFRAKELVERACR